MTEATDLDKAHAQLVEQRSSIIEALAKGYQRGQTENHIELLLKIQSAIDVLRITALPRTAVVGQDRTPASQQRRALRLCVSNIGAPFLDCSPVA